MKSLIQYISVFVVLIALHSCEGFLEEKPNQKLVVPETLTDLQAILDNPSFVLLNHTYLPELSSDDVYITATDYNALESEGDKNAYVWGSKLFDTNTNAWNTTYSGVYYCNSVLEGVETVARTGSNALRLDDIKGQALYYRAKLYLLAASMWCKAYDPGTSDADLGLPFRKGTDFSEKSVRSSLGQTYGLIIEDLRQATILLNQPKVHALRPTKTAAFGMLARAYLFMRKYKEAGAYADSCLRLQSGLLDYNTLNPAISYPLTHTNPEVIILNRIGIPSALSAPIGRVDSILYNSYDQNDLRKTMYFMKNNDNTYSFRGGYTGNGSLFGGIATDEIYLIRAECYAREGKTTEAINDLNTLLSKRWKTATFVPYAAASAEEALRVILEERRKELLFRTLRWPDVKRLNKEGLNITMRRVLGMKQTELPANDSRFILPIPEEVIAISGMPQNE